MIRLFRKPHRILVLVGIAMIATAHIAEHRYLALAGPALMLIGFVGLCMANDYNKK